jgi:3-phytase
MIRNTCTEYGNPHRPMGHKLAPPPIAGKPAGGRKMLRRWSVAWTFALALCGAGCQTPGPEVTPDMGPTTGMLTSSVGTSPALPNLPQDAAIWVNSSDPSKSLVFATERAPITGRLYSYDLSGQNVQSSLPLEGPGLVDLKTGITLGGQTFDLVAVAEADQARIKLFSIDRTTGMMTDITGFTGVFVDRTGDSAIPVGVAIYRRPSDNAGFVVVSPRTGPMIDYLYQYQMSLVAGKINLLYKRRFGSFSTIASPVSADVKGLIVDDAAGYVYYSDRGFGIRKYLADPDAPNPNQELAVFGQQEFMGDRNGLSIHGKADGTGYLLSVD